MATRQTPGEAAYRAFAEAFGETRFEASTGAEVAMGGWEKLPVVVRKAWEASAEAACEAKSGERIAENAVIVQT